MVETSSRYPMSLSVDYPEKLDKLTTFFRIFMVIPIFIILALLVGSNGNQGGQQETGATSMPLLDLLFYPSY